MELARTILVDPATGLPAFNIISAPGKLTDALQNEAFSYPDAITIDKPLLNQRSALGAGENKKEGLEEMLRNLACC